MSDWDEIQLEYQRIARAQFLFYEKLYATTSQDKDPFLKDYYLAQEGLWTAINERERIGGSIYTWESVNNGWNYVEHTLNRARVRGYFGEL